MSLMNLIKVPGLQLIMSAHVMVICPKSNSELVPCQYARTKRRGVLVRPNQIVLVLVVPVEGTTIFSEHREEIVLPCFAGLVGHCRV